MEFSLAIPLPSYYATLRYDSNKSNNSNGDRVTEFHNKNITGFGKSFFIVKIWKINSIDLYQNMKIEFQKKIKNMKDLLLTCCRRWSN